MKKNTLQATSTMNTRLLSIIAIAIIFVCLSLTQTVFGPFTARILNLCAIYAICALSMNLVNGFTGLFSLGQAGFMAVGAYVTTLFMLTPDIKEFNFYLEPIYPWLGAIHIPFVFAILLGGCVAALFACLIGIPVLRLRGDYLAIATLGFSEIIRVVITMQQRITNGSLGIKSIPPMPQVQIGPFRFGTLWWSFGIMALMAYIIHSLMKTSYGRAIKAIREDEVAAEAMGVSLFKHKMYTFIMSGFIAGLAGGLIACHVGTIDPNQFRFVLAYNILLMVVLGGQGSISGSIAGAFIITIGQEALRFIDEPIPLIGYPGVSGMRMVVFSALLMAVILFWSRGMFGSREFSWQGLVNIVKRPFQKKEVGKS